MNEGDTLRKMFLRIALTQVGLLLGAGLTLLVTAPHLREQMPGLWLGLPLGFLAIGAIATCVEALAYRRQVDVPGAPA